MTERFWQHGLKQMVCEVAGLRKAYFCDVLNRRRKVSEERARLLESSCSSLGIDIPKDVWLSNMVTKHPAFGGEPLESELLL